MNSLHRKSSVAGKIELNQIVSRLVGRHSIVDVEPSGSGGGDWKGGRDRVGIPTRFLGRGSRFLLLYIYNIIRRFMVNKKPGVIGLYRRHSTKKLRRSKDNKGRICTTTTTIPE